MTGGSDAAAKDGNKKRSRSNSADAAEEDADGEQEIVCKYKNIGKYHAESGLARCKECGFKLATHGCFFHLCTKCCKSRPTDKQCEYHREVYGPFLEFVESHMERFNLRRATKKFCAELAQKQPETSLEFAGDTVCLFSFPDFVTTEAYCAWQQPNRSVTATRGTEKALVDVASLPKNRDERFLDFLRSKNYKLNDESKGPLPVTTAGSSTSKDISSSIQR